ncbi:MAG: excinuclease ABC subunit UvrA [Pseudohongiellaceae bacterium]|nr:excinuclease ABC subunit UvrA [Pseudohongiellaceae bacterium]
MSAKKPQTPASSHQLDNIQVRGARQNNLKNLDLDLPTNKLIVITGVSGSGKSTLAFDTIYAEGQRRYVETFSAYARQFLDRMDKPAVDSVLGIPPAIAIDQSNPVRTSRSTVGTMTELNDYLKLAYARFSKLYCPSCQQKVTQDSSQSIIRDLKTKIEKDARLHICLPIQIPHNFSEDEIIQLLAQQGYTRIQSRNSNTVEVIQDRLKFREENDERLSEALEVAMHNGNGLCSVHVSNANGSESVEILRYSKRHHCANCDISFDEPQANSFSFNSPIGACEECRGFGRVIGVDYDLVIPDVTKTLSEGAIRPWQTPSYSGCQTDLEKAARKHKIPLNKPWRELKESEQQWVLEGDKDQGGKWYGVRGFFAWLETKSYKMHIRVLLSKYRSYSECQSCKGARLKPESLWWKLETKDGSRGYSINQLMSLSLDEGLQFFDSLDETKITQSDNEAFSKGKSKSDAAALLLNEIRSRLRYLLDVGLGYLSLDRQSRTLSGGEVQRINLTTALGTSLVNTLFVLDEPSIGLHTRDMKRMVETLLRLRDAGNTLIVVEHDPQVMLAADLIIDIGPGPGKAGGRIGFMGTPKQLMKHKSSLTAQYLNGSKLVVTEEQPSSQVADVAASYATMQKVSTQSLRITGASAHNLKSLNVDIPLHKLVCLTGVSGSGKSTLINDVLYRASLKYFGKPSEAPGAHKDITGFEFLDDIVLVDQSPIGKTTRSIPATYVGAFDAIRQQFINTPLAKERSYTKSSFSFNAGKGRCPSCSGNGFEHVEMQFLSDVYLRCPECDGKRYRKEVLEVRITGARPGSLSIADVLELTVAEALEFFSAEESVLRCLQPLMDVGLQYVQLGQAVPTLSGGEAQRLKLAGHLAAVASQKAKTKKSNTNTAKGMLFLLDEPTTGLHFDDIRVLMQAFKKLIHAGHSLLVIEHNLDVIHAADHIIDIGPEGGDNGGELIATGTPAKLMEQGYGLTAKALSDYSKELEEKRAGRYQHPESAKTSKPKPQQAIQIHHAREHNLQNIDVSIPWNKFTVITGVSGSGKSTLAFDLVFAEGQRRYLESLNAYARQFVQPANRPDVDAIHGIPPTVAIEQRTSRGGRKSTVATLTEIYHFLRLLYVKLGTQHCPSCDLPIQAQTIDLIVAQILSQFKNKDVDILAPMVVGRKGIYKDLAAWASSQSYTHMRVDNIKVASNDWPAIDRYKEHNIEIVIGRITITANKEAQLRELVEKSIELSNGLSLVSNARGKGRGKLFSVNRACASCGDSFDELDPRLFSFNSKHGWCPECFGTGETIADFSEEQSGEEEQWLEKDSSDKALESDRQLCKSCNGSRLNPLALAVKLDKVPITTFTALSIRDAEKRIKKLKFNASQTLIARDILPELYSRLNFLNKVGLSYLSLDRSAPSLSGGEAQRIRLASQLGSSLQGVCYILDEPTIGLHARDNALLIDTLRTLQQQGNTVVVVEHDDATMLEADHIIDVGPGAGSRGGKIVAQGSVAAIKRASQSLTGQFLAKPLRHPIEGLRDMSLRAELPKEAIRIEAAHQNNLKNVSVNIPLRSLVTVSGVSGSGKSTLIRSVLTRNLQSALSARLRKKKPTKLVGCKGFSGWESVDRLMQVDQTPIGKTPRSCPASYIGIWDGIRKLFADTVDARLRGYSASRFSFNVGEGRCPSCAGNGMQRIEMNFLPDVRVDCEECKGWRFNEDTLKVRYKDKHIGHVLAMSVDEAVEYFAAIPLIHHPLSLLQDVGLGYLTLGQQSPTLSGGEAQRIKLVAELAKAKPSVQLRRNTKQHCLYILDEPTVGLHMADVEKLLRVLHRLVDHGNSVILIEHNLDMIAESDWLIDIGPEGGAKGGKVVAQGTPLAVSSRKSSHTAKFLKAMI